MLYGFVGLYKRLMVNLNLAYWIVVIYVYLNRDYEKLPDKVGQTDKDQYHTAGGIYLNTGIPDLIMYDALSWLVRTGFLLGPDPRGDKADLPPAHHQWWYHATALFIPIERVFPWYAKYNDHMRYAMREAFIVDRTHFHIYYMWKSAQFATKWWLNKPRGGKAESPKPTNEASVQGELSNKQPRDLGEALSEKVLQEMKIEPWNPVVELTTDELFINYRMARLVEYMKPRYQIDPKLRGKPFGQKWVPCEQTKNHLRETGFPEELI